MKAWLLRFGLLAWLALFAWLPARADTALSLYKSFSGTVNFTGTEATLRSGSNNSYAYLWGYGYVSGACLLVPNGVASAVLKGIPSGATVQSAQLYWAGSGYSVDKTVTMDSTSYTASRSFQSGTTGNWYFSAAADVTAAVKQKGNGTYTFSGLSVSTGSPWCDVQGVVGGFALVVVYSSAGEPFRLLNIYEGFQYFQNSSLTLNLNGFKVPDLSKINATGRIGHITWEGDPTLSGGGETLKFNGVELVDGMNPSGNQFNSQSNVNGDYYSYGVDFDVYTLSSANGTIASGQTTGTTTYKTGQDLVLLSAEIVAIPYVGDADLSLSMTRSGDLTVNSTASYTISVTNKGTDTEIGPVTVVDTLPSGLSYLSATGSGWNCSSAAGGSGTTVVTCSHAGPIAPSTTMASLVLTVSSSSSANYTNSATVSGKTGDSNSANNTATNSYTYTPPSAPASGYAAAFTREPCAAGAAIVVDASVSGCHTFIDSVIAGDTKAKIYITGVTVSNGKQVATSLSSSSTSVPIDFSATCLPNSGVNVSYAGLTLNCNGSAQTATVTVSAGQATASNVSSFFYADVGRVTLSAKYQGALLGSVTFISKPYDIRVRDALRDAGTANEYPDQGGASPTFLKPDIAFVRAGEPFTLRLGAWMASADADGSFWAKSFGKEPAALAGVMAPEFTFGLDEFTVTSPQSPPVSVMPPVVLPVKADQDNPGPQSPDGIVQAAFKINQDFAPSKLVSGAFDANVSWFEAGNLALVPSLGDYLGAGRVPAEPASRMGPSTRVIGRFYPDHLVTEVTAPFACMPAMNCPVANDANTTWPVSGAVYSGQQFAITVKAYGLPRGDDAPLALFQNVPQTSGAHTTIVLSAVPQPNGSGTVKSGNNGVASFLSQALPVSNASTDFFDLSTTASMTMLPAFDAGTRLANNWGWPTLFYVRASMNETRQISGGAAQSFAVSSIAPAGAAAGTQYERGLLAVNGRLQVGNALGSEALRLPVTLTAQYWNGSNWLTNSNDNDSLVAATAPAGTPAPVCAGALAASAGSATCKSGVVSNSNSGTAIRLNAGRGIMLLQQPAPGRLNGSIDYQVSGGDSASWLPSTRARAKFGLYKSPVIYLREVY